MTSRVEQLSEITNSNDVISKFTTDSNNNQACGANRAYYRIVRTAIAAGNVTIPAVIPLRAPCSYIVQAYWQGLSTNSNNMYSVYSTSICAQFAPGGAIASPQTLIAGTAQSISGNTLTYSKNPSGDYLDITLNNTVSGGNITDTLELMVVSNKNF